MIDLELSSAGDVSGQEFGDQGNVGEIDEDTIINPYGYEDRESTFGLIRKKIYYPKSDFGLRLEEFVSTENFTGYFCTVTREIDMKTRYVHVMQ